METNKVTLKLEDYHDLYNFKKNLQENKLLAKVIYNYNGYGGKIEYISLDSALEEITVINKNLIDNATYLQNLLQKSKADILRLSEKPTQPIDLMINEIKKFSIWQFLKWRKS
jgi:transcription antitermination factor NusA-like protein